MATRKPEHSKHPQQAAVDTAYLNSDSGPALAPGSGSKHPALKKARAVGAMVDGMPANSTKAAEYGPQSARAPAGGTQPAPDEAATASTLSEKNRSAKTGGRAGA
ncbi:catalase HPII, partial [Bordetella petrii]|nr:catalase HPII [Bordetella petrii]